MGGHHGLLIRSMYWLFLLAPSFSSLSLFVVTKSNQKRPDKMNSLRLRLRSNRILSQWKGLFYASRSWMKFSIAWNVENMEFLGFWGLAAERRNVCSPRF